MAFRRIISKRFLFSRKRDSPPLVITPSTVSENGVGHLLTRKPIHHAPRKPPDFFYTPVGDILREKLWSLNKPSTDNLSFPRAENLDGVSLSETDVNKMCKCWKMEKVRSKLRQIPMSSIVYSEFLKICSEVCENDEARALECAKMLDDAGNVIVAGKIVFIRPDQIARSMEKLIYESMAMPNDPRKQELEKLEKEKAVIDVKAASLVRRELYCGLGFLLLQTMGFMRLTFWELSWDVMEPICFFVTSLHFALAYGFFIRTSKEPTFESFFRRRFVVKQAKLMKVRNFDVEKYEQLSKIFYPGYNSCENN